MWVKCVLNNPYEESTMSDDNNKTIDKIHLIQVFKRMCKPSNKEGKYKGIINDYKKKVR